MNRLIFCYDNNSSINNIIINRNCLFRSQYVFPVTPLDAFPATFNHFIENNTNPRALIATPFLPVFGRTWPNTVNSSIKFEGKNDDLQLKLEKLKAEKLAEKVKKKKSDSSNVINKRKSTKPQKCVAFDDPNFKGVTFKIGLEIRKDFQTELNFQHVYNGLTRICNHQQHRRRRRRRVRSSSIDDDKQCASCGTAKTPLWRDAEDGTPLCNACGIRYKKYRIRCTTCWRIPRKDRRNRVFCSCNSR